MKKTGMKKITLNKETLRVLEDARILIALGGDAEIYQSGSCAGSVCSVVSCPSAC